MHIRYRKLQITLVSDGSNITGMRDTRSLDLSSTRENGEMAPEASSRGDSAKRKSPSQN